MRVGLVVGFAVAVLLSACGPAQRAKVEKMPDADIAAYLREPGDVSRVCKVLENPSWYGPKTIKVAQEIAHGAGVGDCSPDHHKCIGWGMAFASPAYAECRQRLEVAKRQSQAGTKSDGGKALMEWGQQMMKSGAAPRSTTTSCHRTSFGMDCSTR
jgi:hypothetical protein